MSLLEIKDLNISYKTRKETIVASSDVNFILERGEILGIVGESGSGKSTIANAIINLIDPPGEITSGLIKIDGNELQNNEEIIQKIRGKKIGFVFQDPQTSLNPLFKIKDQLIETIQTHLNLSYEEALKKSINLLKEVGIDNAEKRIEDYPHQFSGGMRQRVVIALAISCEPDLIIADEPTTALDVSIQFQILELLKELTKTDIRKVRSVARDMDSVSFKVKKQVIEQFYYSFVSEKFQSEEGAEDEPKKPFAFLDELTDEQLISMVLPDDTRVKAIVMAQVNPEKRAKVLERLGPEEKGRVLIEMGTLDEVPLEAVVSIASELQEKSHFLPKTVNFSRGGGKDVADILGEMEPDDESKYLEAISREAPALAEEIKKYHLHLMEKNILVMKVIL